MAEDLQLRMLAVQSRQREAMKQLVAGGGTAGAAVPIMDADPTAVL